MGILLRIVRVLWVLWIVFLYFLLLPAICRSSGAFIFTIFENARLLAEYYGEHRALPPELSLYAKSPEKAIVHTENIYKPAVVRGDGREFAAACRVSLGLGDRVWQAKPSPLLVFPENLEKDGRAIMMFFVPTSVGQPAVFKLDNEIIVGRLPVAEAKNMILEHGISPYRLQILRPRWQGMIFHIAMCVITVCLFLPVGKISVGRRWTRGVAICGAAVPLCLMLFCADGYPGAIMIPLGLAVLWCGIAEIFRCTPKPLPAETADTDRV